MESSAIAHMTERVRNRCVKTALRTAFLTLLCANFGTAQDPSSQANMLSRLAAEATQFERRAHTVIGRETLRQTILDSARMGRSGPRKGEPWPPRRTREIVSEYGFLWLDESPSTIREMRQVVMVDGRKVKSTSRTLDALAAGITAKDEKQQRLLLEQFEKHGLRGVATDFGPLLLLFLPDRLEAFEFRFRRKEVLNAEEVLVFSYQQLDGPAALTIFEAGENNAIRVRLQGEIWARAADFLPIRISLDSERLARQKTLLDRAYVDYRMSEWKVLLPERVTRRQWQERQLLVEDLYEYGGYRQISGGR